VSIKLLLLYVVMNYSENLSSNLGMSFCSYRKGKYVCKSDSLVCQHCQNKRKSVRKTRQNTKYVNEESNFVTLCYTCRKENDDYWEDMWNDYYSGCM